MSFERPALNRAGVLRWTATNFPFRNFGKFPERASADDIADFMSSKIELFDSTNKTDVEKKYFYFFLLRRPSPGTLIWDRRKSTYEILFFVTPINKIS